MDKLRRSIRERAFEILDHVAVIRPMLLIPVWTMLLIGHYQAEVFSSPYRSNSIPDQPLALLKTFIIYSMILGAVYILNQICDVKTDSINNKLYLVAKGYVNIANLKFEIAVLAIGAIFFTLYWFSDKLIYLVLVLISAFLGSVYSLRPLRLKGRAIFDLLANVCGYGFVAFSAGWLSTANLSWETFKSAFPYAMFVAAAFINTTLPDMEGDRENGDSTVGTLLGVKKSCFLSAFLIMSAFIASLAVKDKLAIIVSLISMPLFVLMAIKSEMRIITLTTKVSLLSLSIAIGIKMPYYLLLLLGTIVSVRWYYSARFGVKYP